MVVPGTRKPNSKQRREFLWFTGRGVVHYVLTWFREAAVVQSFKPVVILSHHAVKFLNLLSQWKLPFLFFFHIDIAIPVVSLG